MIRTSRAATIGLLLALCACSQQDQVSAINSGAPGIQGLAAVSASPVSGSRGFDAIASSPDRGALVNYDRRTVPLKQGAYTSHPVQVSEEHAIRAIITGKMSIPAPGGEYLQLKYERHAENPNGNWTWVGRLAGGDPSQEAIITFGEKAVFGSIPQSGGRPALSLTTRGGKLWVIETDPRLAPGIDRREQDTLVPVAAARRQLAAATSSGAQAASSSTASAIAKSSHSIDVLLGYTTGFAAKFGGQSQAVTRLTHLVDINNQAYANSQINGTVRLVGTQQVTYPDGGTNKSALIDLTGHDGSRATAVPASLQPLRAARDTLGADLVALVRAYEYVNEGCGIAWLLGSGQQAIVPSEDAPFAYSIVSNLPDGTSVQGPDGKNYFCAKETVAHELAHLMGSAHDINNSESDGRYAYSYGAKTGLTAGNFYTIMSYGDDDQTSYRVFSNPNVTLCGGLACGVANQADNARSLNSTIPVVSGFRVAVAASHPQSDINGDGNADIIWHNPTQAKLAYWLMSGAQISGSAVLDAPAGFKLLGTGDFDGNGRAELLWSGNGTIYSSTFTGSGFVGAFIGSYDSGWSAAAADDINGDGNADIIWHNPTQSKMAYWLMNGAQIIGSALLNAPAGFKLLGTGDFDGNGRAELLWSGNGAMYSSTFTGSGFVGAYIGSHDTGWIAAAADDINGDGNADIIWHNPTQAKLAYWLMNGAQIGGSAVVDAPPGFTLVGTGDFDGNGRAELLWSGNGSIYSSTFTGAGFTGALIGSHDSGWMPIVDTLAR